MAATPSSSSFLTSSSCLTSSFSSRGRKKAAGKHETAQILLCMCLLLLHVDEPHRFQSRQRFSDRRAADLKTLRKRLNGIKLFTRLKLARFYLLQQCVSDFFVDFFVLICLYFNAITPSLVNLDVYRLLYFFLCCRQVQTICSRKVLYFQNFQNIMLINPVIR